ncbi:restriction endonuclease subunit S [Fusicatenibacter sp.]
MKIKDICEAVTDGSHNPPQGISSSGYMMLSSKNIFDDEITFEEPRYLSEDDFLRENKRTKISEGDVLLTIVGTVGRTAVVDGDMPSFTLQRSVAVLHPKRNICISRFLMYALRGKHRFIENRAKGVAQKGIYLGEVSEIDISIPDINEQKVIVEKLDKICDIIKLRKQELTNLDELMKARFVEMFGDVKTNIFGWKRCIFDEITTKITDGEHGTVPRVEEGKGHLYFMARNITKDGLIDLSEVSFVPDSVHQKIYKRCNPEANDILLVCVGATIGKSALVSEELGEFSMARSVALLKPNKEKVNSLFLLNLLRSDAIQNDISNCAHAAAQAGLYTNMIKKLDAFLPPMGVQEQFADFVKQIDKSKVAE